MPTHLLATKLHIPPLRASAVARPRLLRQFSAGLDENRKLTLISAPAGYGKTTLVTGWIHSTRSRGWRVGWLSLDKGDNDPARFFSHWVAAFQRVDDSIQRKIQPLLDLPKLPPAAVLMDELLNELAAIDAPILLVFEDFHAISTPAIHEALEYFIEHQPPGVHLAITTRQDPPLPLARLRAYGQMAEIRARDLRFTPEEARQFFVQAMSLDLADPAVDVLDERTEGWAVGLQLAGLALQRQNDPQDFIASFRGSHRYVFDYLAEEVIRQLGKELRDFLTRTSILERFNAEICTALTGRADAQAVIDQLEQANLFVVPLDDARTWYRYHHLFSDYLRILLSKPEQVDLYKKASAWHASADLPEEAVEYALASQDMDFAADMIERALASEAAWSVGNVGLLASWLEALQPHVFQHRPQLSLNASRVAYLSARFDQAESYITLAEQALNAQPPSLQTEGLLALASVYRGSIASVRGEVQQAVEQITAGMARLPREYHLAHARGYFGLGLAYELADQPERAVQNYLQSSDEAISAGVLFLGVHARCSAAQVQIAQGRLNLAEQTCRSAIALAEGARIPPLGLAWIIQGGILLERNELAEAESLLQNGIALARKGGLSDDVVLGMSHLGRLRAVQGDAARAYAVHQEASGVMDSYDLPRLTVIASAFLARIQLMLNHAEQAQGWAAGYQQTRETLQHDFADLTLARVLLATGAADSVPTLLHPILKKALAAGRMQACIEAMLLLALYHHARQEPAEAVEWLGKSLQLAAPEGYARIYLDEGPPMLALLAQARAHAPAYVDTLLGKRGLRQAQAEASPNDRLPEPLSEQELRILRLIMDGKSNQEIAQELVITVGTAKWHVHNVLQKLGVGNRAQAIARAREFGF